MGRNGKAIDWNVEWIYENFPKYRLITELHKAYCQECFEVGLGAFKSWFRRNKIHSNFSWTEEQLEWLKNNYPYNPVRDTTEEFNRLFGTNKNVQSIRAKACVLGLHLTEEARSKSYITPNHAEIGDIHKDPSGYMYIKSESGKWMLYHRYIYEKHFGEIPEGYIVIFLDSNIENFNPENLAIVSLKTNALMNGFKFRTECAEITRAGLLCCELYELISD